MGVKPLYIYQANGHFAFSSEIKAFKQAGLPLSLDQNGIGKYLIFKYSPGNESLFKEVSRLKPGAFLRYQLENNQVNIEPYWKLSKNIEPFKGSYGDATEELRAKLQQAVECRLMGDVPIANYLSGGLDSSLIAHYLRGGDHVHYCAVKNRSDLRAEGSTSDGHFAARLASEWDLNLKEIPIGLEALTEKQLEKAMYACDDLIADGSIIPAMLIAKEAARDHKVVLSGMGADELFLGYNGHFLQKLSQMAQTVPGAQAGFGAVFRQINAGNGPFKAYRRYLQKWGASMGKSYETSRYSIVGDVDTSMKIFRGDAGFDSFVAPYFPEGKDPFDALFSFELENFLVKNLHYLDRSSMAYSMESRVPFLDHELVTFAAGLPTKFKLDYKLKSKKILKEAYRKELPGYITKRRKAGFGMPLRSLLAKQEVLDRLLPFDFFGGMECFDVYEIKRAASNHIAGRQDHSALIYSLISFRVWHGKFF
jgi:asparagine synthase (glutamine-hydrolysing)